MTVSRCFALFTFALIVLHCWEAAVIVKRATEESTENFDNGGDAICHRTTPCGWAIYNKFNRKIMYFMKNPCTCPETTECILTDDDLQTTSYVYRCLLYSEETNITRTLAA